MFCRSRLPVIAAVFWSKSVPFEMVRLAEEPVSVTVPEFEDSSVFPKVRFVAFTTAVLVLSRTVPVFNVMPPVTAFVKLPEVVVRRFVVKLVPIIVAVR